MTITEYLKPLYDEFARLGDPIQAERMSKYMRNKFAHYGVPSKPRKEIFKNFLRENPDLKGRETEVIKAMWESPYREVQYCAVELAAKYVKKCDAEFVDVIEDLVQAKSWWDTVDGLAAGVAGTFFVRFPEKILDKTQTWTDSEDFWLRRTALLFQLKYKEKTDFELLKKYILANADSKEFFIRKAIGWALREYSKTNPEAVKKFVSEAPISEFSKKEALKWLNRKR